MSRDSIFRFIESELKATRAVLPASRPADQAGRVDQGAADAILASLYLNAQVYTGTVTRRRTGEGHGPVAGRDHRGGSRDQLRAVRAVGRLAEELHPRQSRLEGEHLLHREHRRAAGARHELPDRTLHYSQLNVQGGPWNGFATVAETYNAFDPADARRNIFLVGQQSASTTACR